MSGRRALRGWLLAVGTSILGLAASGAWLAVRYRPDRPPEPGASGFIRLPSHGGGWVGNVHRILAYAFYLLLAALLVALLMRVARRPAPPWLAVGLVGVAVVATVVTHMSGTELPWSQLALWAVKVDSRYEGVWRAAFDGSVRFVLSDREVPQSEYRVQVMAHLFAAPAAVLVALLAAAVTLKRRR